MKPLILLLMLSSTLMATAGCGSDEEFTCVCTNTLTGAVIDRSTVVGADINEAQEECDDRESFTVPDRCVIEE